MRRLGIVIAVLALACGKRGDPRPPVPIIPQATSDLVVTQRAGQVILSWSYPSLTTTGRSLTDIRRISVFRYIEELPASAVGRDPNQLLPGDVDPTVPQPIALFAKVPTLPQAQFVKLSTRVESIEKANLGAVTTGSKLIYADNPPLRSIDGRPVRVTYAVVTEGTTARSQLSNMAIIVPLPVATPPTALAASARPEGVVLTWQAPATSVSGGEAPIVTGYQIFRTASGQPLADFPTPINTAPVTGTTYTDVPPYGEHEYRVTAVATTGPPVLQSDLSAPASVKFRDLVPPPPVTSVTTLVETSSVRLIWDAVDAPDFAGYRVYRSEGVGHDANIRDVGTIPLGNPITTTYYVDTRVDLGISFRYAVTTIDKSGNESAKTWSEWVVAPKTP